MSVTILTAPMAVGAASVTRDVTLVAAGTALTNGYVPATDAGNCVRTNGYDLVVFKGPYVEGAEDTVQLICEGSSDGGTTWYPLCYKDNQASGVSELTQDVMNMTPGSFTDIPLWSTPPIDCGGWELLRARAKATGASITGTWGCLASLGRKMAA